jgi:hypothetical protein
VGCNYSSGGGTHRGSAHVIFGNAAPFARLPAAVATWIQSGGVPAIISIAAVAASHYVDRQPFAGAALTQTPLGAPGSWSFRQTATDAFQPLPADLGRNNALVLAASAQLAFLPEAGFVGTTALPLRFWDGSGGYSPGRFDIDAEIGSLGGFANDANVHSVIVSVGDTSFADGFE